MPTLNLDLFQSHRAGTFGLRADMRVASPAEALDFVNRRGFIHFWPIKGADLPSLWTSVAGDRPVPNEHDDAGHITWGWKDNALDKRIWYYAKVLRKKATMISMDIAPYFYALSENYGSPEEDYLIAYREGRMTLEAKQVCEALLDKGPLHSIELRRVARLANAKPSVFSRALDVLQADFKILPVGVAEAGAWRYAFIYDVVARYYPDLPDKARYISEPEARRKLLELYFESVGAAQLKDAVKLFGWGADLTSRSLRGLLEREFVRDSVSRSDMPGEWLALSKLVA